MEDKKENEKPKPKAKAAPKAKAQAAKPPAAAKQNAENDEGRRASRNISARAHTGPTQS